MNKKVNCMACEYHTLQEIALSKGISVHETCLLGKKVYPKECNSFSKIGK